MTPRPKYQQNMKGTRKILQQQLFQGDTRCMYLRAMHQRQTMQFQQDTEDRNWSLVQVLD
jgi:hypothetical protein